MQTSACRGTRSVCGQTFDYTIKIILTGDVRVGKTTFLHRFVSGEFNSHLKQSDGMGPRTKVLERDGKKILTRIWDTAGQERFRSLTTSHYRDVHGCLLLYDVTNEQSFDHVLYWYNDLQDKSEPLPKIILVGTKCHMYRVVSRDRAEKLAENLEVPYMEEKWQ
ncbi:ras-related protein Rab-8B-like isoform X2 [Liolophura sinensis]|uniref:ras-related protein Rab-8B-like isoform X2 n=1 Tax=Liolophura sinensis TaxID=3198878 RepID=UPI003157F42B